VPFSAASEVADFLLTEDVESESAFRFLLLLLLLFLFDVEVDADILFVMVGWGIRSYYDKFGRMKTDSVVWMKKPDPVANLKWPTEKQGKRVGVTCGVWSRWSVPPAPVMCRLCSLCPYVSYDYLSYTMIVYKHTYISTWPVPP
jgi:hypothetical protein